MATFNHPNVASPGNAIIASDHEGNWMYLKQWLEGVPGQTDSKPGVVQNTGGAITGNLSVTGSVTAGSYNSTGVLTSTGTVSLGATDHLYLNSSQHSVIGLSTGTDINAETAGSFLKDHNYRANFLSSSAPGGVAGPGNNTHWLSRGIDVAAPAADAGNYLSESHRYSVYSRRAGEGYVPPGGVETARPESEYRLVINGSMAIRGDIIGYSNKNESVPGTSTDYGLGLGTRIDCQWLNVGANVDIGGELRVQTRFDYARIYMGNDYSGSDHDYLEWKDNLPVTNLPGFQFVHNNNAHLTISESGPVGSTVLDLRAQNGWPTLASTTTAGITTTGSHQLGIVSSSERYKEDIADVDLATAKTKIAALTPRTFKWDAEVSTASGIDYQNQTPETGFIAEEVADVAPDWVSYDSSDLPQTWRHQSVVSALVAVVQDLENRVGALE